MDNKIIKSISEYAKLFSSKKYIESGYIAVRDSDGIAVTVAKADLNNIGENDVVFVNDKNIESFEGNFRAAAVILFCAIRQDKMSEAAAIVDSDAILKYSSKRKPLQPVMDNVAKMLGITVKCASKNVAAEIVTALSGYRNACFMPDAGAVIKARSLQELIEATYALDKACIAETLAEDKGGTQHINPLNALIEQTVYKLQTRSAYNKSKADAADLKAESLDNDDTSDTVAVSEQVVSDGTADSENKNEQSESAENAQENTQAIEQSAKDEADTTEGNDNVAQAEDKNFSEADIIRKVTLENGKLAALVCPCYVSAVCAIAKPMTVTAEYTGQLGEEIKCLPSKTIFSDKAFVKALELTGDDKISFMAQRGAIIKADDDRDLNDKLTLLEKACKAYFEA